MGCSPGDAVRDEPFWKVRIGIVYDGSASVGCAATPNSARFIGAAVDNPAGATVSWAE